MDILFNAQSLYEVGYIINPIFQINKLGLRIITAVTIFSYNCNLASPILSSKLSYFHLPFYVLSSQILL